MIELFILFFTITFALSFGWVMGKRMGNLIGSQIEVWWDKAMDFLKRIPQLFRFIPILIQNIWYWKVRRKKLIETMKRGNNHPFSSPTEKDDATWALAERLKNSDRGRTRSEE